MQNTKSLIFSVLLGVGLITSWTNGYANCPGATVPNAQMEVFFYNGSIDKNFLVRALGPYQTFNLINTKLTPGEVASYITTSPICIDNNNFTVYITDEDGKDIYLQADWTTTFHSTHSEGTAIQRSIDATPPGYRFETRYDSIGITPIVYIDIYGGKPSPSK